METIIKNTKAHTLEDIKIDGEDMSASCVTTELVNKDSNIFIRKYKNGTVTDKPAPDWVCKRYEATNA